MNIYEQLAQTENQLASVRLDLDRRDEMEAWEVKEYQAIESLYTSKIAELNGFIAELENKLYITKEQYGTKSAYIYRIIADNGNGTVTAMPSMTKKNRQPVTGLRRVELTTHFHIDDLVEVK